MGDSIVAQVQFPYSPAPDPMRYYEGAILRPADTALYPGKRPVVLIQHGWGNDMCSLWWVAQYLAGHGFVATIHETPFFGDPDDFFIRVLEDMPLIINADLAVIDYLGSNDNIFADFTDATKLGYAGHGVGSMAASYIPGQHPELGIDAVAALNNLRALVVGDPGGVYDECLVEPQIRTLPTVPALGIAMDEPCESNPTNTGPTLKIVGWEWWKSYAIPSMEVVMRGYGDSDFVGDNDGTDAWKDMGHYLDAWFGRWLNGDPTRTDDLLTATLNGRPTIEALSERYRSAAYLPPENDTGDLVSCLKGLIRCDGRNDSDPDPDPDPLPAKFKLEVGISSHRLRPGSIAKIGISAGNTGGSAAKAKVCVESAFLKVLGKRCRSLGEVQPDTHAGTVYRIKAGRYLSAKSRTRIRTTLISSVGNIERVSKFRLVRGRLAG